ncbi:MAG TPA: phosphatase PAP2 family protein [Streptosporangiaceae bacterium]|jgi:membrane-associated phospholipid phosphatase
MADMRATLRRIRRPGPLVALSIGYLILVSGIMMWRGISVDPDYLLLLMVPLALLTGRFVAFLRDWVPFIALFLGYEALSGVAPKLGIAPHIYGMVRIERDLFFGRSPNQVLQEHFGDLRWLAIVCTIVYFCHFLYPLLVGLVLWLVNRQFFVRYVVALLAMSFAAFVVFLLIPTAPPWWAHNVGALPGVHDLVSRSLPSKVSPYFRHLDADRVAAFPSLHAAYPTLGALALWRMNRKTAFFTVPWCFIVFFSVIFLGEHYAIDVLGGIAVAVGTWLAMNYLVFPHVKSLSAQDGAEERVVPVDEVRPGDAASAQAVGQQVAGAQTAGAQTAGQQKAGQQAASGQDQPAELHIPAQTRGAEAGIEPAGKPGNSLKR